MAPVWVGKPRRMASLACAVAAMLSGCSTGNLLSRLDATPSPHERYTTSLRGANLHETAMGRDWLQAGDAALATALAVPMPFRESGYFPLEPSAVAYRFDLQRGRRLTVDVAFESLPAGSVFVDLFERRDGEPPERVASLAEGANLTYEVARDGVYLLRVQPELMRSGRFTLVQRTVASLTFPVSGLTAAAVESEFGAARDAGRREHEGIDIFAKRGTPVVAVRAGRADADTNGLGGNVVWLRESRSGRRFYYAHLDRWAFDGTASVRAGDVLGYVGNTGNARTTSPHLHFGIYERGAVDPLPFVRRDDPTPAAVDGLDRLAERVRVSAARTAVLDGAGTNAAVARQLDRAAAVRVLGVTRSFLRVAIPDGTTGYISSSATRPVGAALRQQRLNAGDLLRERPLDNAPAVIVLAAAVQVNVLGQFGAYLLVTVPSVGEGWVKTSRTDS